jgi:hypothetical protein
MNGHNHLINLVAKYFEFQETLWDGIIMYVYFRISDPG